MKLRVLDRNDDVIYSGTGPVTFPDRLAKVAVTILIDDLDIPSPGVYFFVLHVDDEMIAQTRFQVFHHEN